MKKLVAVKNYLPLMFAVALFAGVGSSSAFAQAQSHDGSLLPHYFDSSGELKWGSWGPAAEAAPAVHRQALRPTRSLIQNAGSSAHTRVQ
jgi:hypothetical protein